MSKIAQKLSALGLTRAGALAAIAAVCLYRIVPHLPNLTPVGAMFVLGGLYLGGGLMWMAAPFIGLLISDTVLNLAFDGRAVHPDRAFDYLAFALIALGARWAAKRPAAARIGVVVGAPVAFFLVSNFGVWLAGGMYAHTPAGLAECYTAALPFFRGTLFGDWLFAGAGMLMLEGLKTREARTAALAA
ncbi:DUF6580 family putative transport protein [Phenylobacterium soli]|uniref:Uncharacterized protein n=1 Tax=Phenylobacterium soli TaxID=2170551 RepID=A0A328AIJ2_9CAUL|nr:DUF6580 family putative transport protein [Phenylobacterium soli]RAK54341.1 hypothetical protein DJ017_07295 [Phenylobacterium soli]